MPQVVADSEVGQKWLILPPQSSPSNQSAEPELPQSTSGCQDKHQVMKKANVLALRLVYVSVGLVSLEGT